MSSSSISTSGDSLSNVVPARATAVEMGPTWTSDHRQLMATWYDRWRETKTAKEKASIIARLTNRLKFPDGVPLGLGAVRNGPI